MASLMKDWLVPFIEEHIQNELAQSASATVKIKTETIDAPEIPDQNSYARSDDGSNLRLRMAAHVRKVGVVQILRFDHGKTPVTATVSDGHSSITAQFSTAAIHEYAKTASKELTKDNLHNLLYLRKFELVISKYGPIDRAVSLFVEQFTLKGSIPNGVFGRPEPIANLSTIISLLCSLRETFGTKTATVHVGPPSNPLFSGNGRRISDHQNNLASQANFFSQAPAPSSDDISNIPLLQPGSKLAKETPSLDLLNQPKAARQEALLRLLQPSITRLEKGTNNGIKSPAQLRSDPTKADLVAPTDSGSDIQNVLEPQPDVTEINVSNSEAAKSILLSPSIKDHFNIGELTQPSSGSILRTVQPSSWHSLICRVPSVSLPLDQEYAMERKGALIQPGSQLPIANIPNDLLRVFSDLADRRAEEKVIPSQHEASGASIPFQSPITSTENVVESVSAGTTPKSQHLDRSQGRYSSEEASSESTEVSEVPFSSQLWPSSSIGPVNEELPPDTPRITDGRHLENASAISVQSESGSELELAEPVPLLGPIDRLENFGGKKLSESSPQEPENRLLEPSSIVLQTPYSYPRSKDFTEGSPHVQSDQVSDAGRETPHTPTNTTTKEQFCEPKKITTTEDDQSSPLDADLRSEPDSIQTVESGTAIPLNESMAEDRLKVEIAAASQHIPRADFEGQSGETGLLPTQSSFIPEIYKSPLSPSQLVHRQQEPKRVFDLMHIGNVASDTVLDDDFDRPSKRIKTDEQPGQQAKSSEKSVVMARRERRSFMRSLKEQDKSWNLPDNNFNRNSNSPSSVSRDHTSSTSLGSKSDSVDNAEEIYKKFVTTYDDYKGTFKLFCGLCRQLVKLRRSNTAPHRSLWDDFIIRWNTDYTNYLTDCTTQGESPVPYDAYYRDVIEHPLYQKRVISPSFLELVAGADYNISIASSARSRTTLETSPRQRQLASPHAMIAPGGPDPRAKSTRDSKGTPTAKSNHSPTSVAVSGTRFYPMRVEESDSEPPIPNVNQMEKVSGFEPSLIASSPLNPDSFSRSTRRRISRVLPWKTIVKSDETAPSQDFEPTSLQLEAGQNDNHSFLRQYLQLSQAAEEDSLNEEMSNDVADAEWWKDKNTPFKEFAKAFGDLQSLYGYLPTIGSKPLPASCARKIDISKWHF